MGHLWLHTFHLPLCVTVINILLTQNTRPQWFTWANYKCFHTSRTKCACSFLSHPPSQSLPSLTHQQSESFFLFHPAGSQALPNPIPLSNFFQTPFPRQTSLSHQAPCSPRLPSFLTLGLVPSRSGTAHPYQCRPVGRNPAVFIWEREEEGRKGGTGRQKGEIEKEKAEDKVTTTTIYTKEDASHTRMVGNEINKPVAQIPIVGEMYRAVTFPFLRWNGVKSSRRGAGRGP